MEHIEELDVLLEEEEFDALLEPISLFLEPAGSINDDESSGTDKSMDETEPLIAVDEDASPQRTIGVAQLALITYMITCGGPFGFEVSPSCVAASFASSSIFCLRRAY